MFDRIIKSLLLIGTVISILVTVLIVLSVFSETIRLFTHVSPFGFFFGTE